MPHPPLAPNSQPALPRILVVEDEPDIAELIVLHLSDLPARVVHASDGSTGLQAALNEAWSAVVLDIRLPGLNGLDLCRELRARANPVPVLMLTARNGELDRVLGLELGADDYLTKPFSVLELRARVRALMRRAALSAGAGGGAQSDHPKPGEPATTLQFPGLKIDRVQRRAWCGPAEVLLTPREFDLLWHFVQQPGRVFTRSELLADVWGYGHDGYDHTVNSHINRLRTKLGGGRDDNPFIHTVWGVGYRFEVKA